MKKNNKSKEDLKLTITLSDENSELVMRLEKIMREDSAAQKLPKKNKKS